MLIQKTLHHNSESADKKWFVIDAENMVVGRLATTIASILRGKTKPSFSTHCDVGDFVVVVNAEKVRLTGGKENRKVYNHHSNHIGGIKTISFKEMLVRNPENIIMSAVQGMLPKTTLGRKQLTKLKVFAGTEHTHEAQKPEKLNLK